ncbi:MAG: replication-relaxation family protein [Bdellovibrionales bacterium]
MELTERDKIILLDIQTFGLMPTKLIADRHFKGIALTTTLRRLRILEDASYIRRIEGLRNGAVAWCLTKTAALEFDAKASKLFFPQHVLDHDLTLNDVRLKLEAAGFAHSWLPEHVIRSKMARALTVKRLKHRNVPDAIIGVELHDGSKHAVALEVEMTAKNQQRYRDIHSQYRSNESLWGYWYIVKRPSIGKQVMLAAENVYRYSNQGPHLMWSLLEDVNNDPRATKVIGRFKTTTVGELFRTCSFPCSVSEHPA